MYVLITLCTWRIRGQVGGGWVLGVKCPQAQCYQILQARSLIHRVVSPPLTWCLYGHLNVVEKRICESSDKRTGWEFSTEDVDEQSLLDLNLKEAVEGILLDTSLVSLYNVGDCWPDHGAAVLQGVGCLAQMQSANIPFHV